jgi:hypothetical protein
MTKKEIKMNKIFTNKEIYNFYFLINENIIKENIILPVKVNFAIQKNFTILVDLSEEIEKIKEKICIQNGKYISENNSFQIDKDKIESTQQQLDDLMKIKQEVKIYTIKLEDLENIQLTSKQMQALLFMIEDE